MKMNLEGIWMVRQLGRWGPFYKEDPYARLACHKSCRSAPLSKMKQYEMKNTGKIYLSLWGCRCANLSESKLDKVETQARRTCHTGLPEDSFTVMTTIAS